MGWFVVNEGVLYAPQVIDMLIYTVTCGQAIAMMVLGWIVQKDIPAKEQLPTP